MVTKFAGYSKSDKLAGRFRSAIVAGALSTLLFASGCSIAGNSLPDLTSPDQIVTDSVVTKAKPDGLADTDANIIKQSVADAAVKEHIDPIAWSNPETGTSGSIVAIDKFMGKHGQKCRGFKTSVTSFTGVGLYNGETCQIGPGKWVLSWFKSTDSI